MAYSDFTKLYLKDNSLYNSYSLRSLSHLALLTQCWSMRRVPGLLSVLSLSSVAVWLSPHAPPRSPAQSLSLRDLCEITFLQGTWIAFEDMEYLRTVMIMFSAGEQNSIFHDVFKTIYTAFIHQRPGHIHILCSVWAEGVGYISARCTALTHSNWTVED